ncbi:hypothetical protein TH53_07235 [Pedobacter lusitanus]|uniref:Contig29, whole genome shotgun sequence n=1 Tax=Pedobacter lusitanus TaxID=1503925 RepID=A0A0D0GNH1_9SPHI|nr:hypothetical protein [Pedobacter lusitanus]KIO77725.1 hypothetical protein TH53_07235 [Pedobacter lusitanus]
MQDLHSSGIPGDFFTTASLGTLAGATGAVYIICSTIQKVFNFNPKWLALLVSVLISFAAALFTQPIENDISRYFIALLNGFLIYATATGTNQVFGTKPDTQTTTAAFRQTIKSKRRFSTTWW